VVFGEEALNTKHYSVGFDILVKSGNESEIREDRRPDDYYEVA
jgi:hypothetical protein